MTILYRLSRPLVRGAAGTLLAGFLLCATQISAVSAAVLDIQFTGVDLRYESGTGVIHDQGDVALAGSVDTSKADSLSGMNFSVDGTSVGSLGTDIFLDLEIPNVVGLPLAGGSVVTSGSPAGTFELLMPGVGLTLSLGRSEIFYVPVLGGTVNFAFAGSVASISAQSLPFGLTIGDPVSVSFSTQIVSGTLTDDGTFVTGFDSRGTGEVSGSGTQVPEPSCLVLIGLAVGLVTAKRRRRPSLLG